MYWSVFFFFFSFFWPRTFFWRWSSNRNLWRERESEVFFLSMKIHETTFFEDERKVVSKHKNDWREERKQRLRYIVQMRTRSTTSMSELCRSLFVYIPASNERRKEVSRVSSSSRDSDLGEEKKKKKVEEDRPT